MATNLALDDALIDEARRLGAHPTKRAAVTAALEEYVARRKQARVLSLVGRVPYASDYDQKVLRKRRP